MLSKVEKQIWTIIGNASRYLLRGGKFKTHCIATKDGLPDTVVCKEVCKTTFTVNNGGVCTGTCVAKYEAEQMAKRTPVERFI